MQFEKSVFLRRVVDQLFKSNLTFCVVCVFNLQFEKSLFLRRVVHSQFTLQRQLRRQILKKHPLYICAGLKRCKIQVGRLQPFSEDTFGGDAQQRYFVRPVHY
jgi:hypothetical protein